MSLKHNFSIEDPRVKIFTTEQEAFSFAALKITELIEIALHNHGSANLVIAAGISIERTLACLHKKNLNWQKVNWFLADERCVAIDDRQRNEIQIRNALRNSLGKEFGKVISPSAQEIPSEAAQNYASRIESISMFDFCLLGMGNDGHIASLFPNHLALSSSDPCFLVNDSPNPPAQRITLTLKTLARTDNRILITAGSKKADAIKRFIVDPQSPVRLFNPSMLIADRAAYQ